MDFALPHIHTPSVVTNSTIRYIPVPDPATAPVNDKKNQKNADDDNDNDDNGTKGRDNDKATTQLDTDHYYKNLTLDEQLHVVANHASAELFLGPPEPNSDEAGGGRSKTGRAVDAAAYPERSTPQSLLIEPGALVVIFESFDNLNFCYATPGQIFSNRNGHFHHDDFIGKPYGSKIRSRNNRGYGYVHLLKPTPELWARSLNHRTQIIHELDSSMIVFYLHLRPNMVVCESGTGSGALSHAIMRCIAPHGKLHTYEFNAMRARTARAEFDKNGLSHLVQVHHRDVCGKMKKKKLEKQLSEEATATEEEEEEKSKNSGENAVDDSEDDGCGGFQRPDESVDAVVLDLPEPWEAVRHAAVCLKLGAGRIASYSPCMEQTQRTVAALSKYGFHSIQTKEFRLKEYYLDEVELDCTLPQTKRPKFVDPRFHNNLNSTNLAADKTIDNNNGDHDDGSDANANKKYENVPKTSKIQDRGEGQSNNTKKHLVARPFGMMRGHTAFLTFATRSNLPSSSLQP